MIGAPVWGFQLVLFGLSGFLDRPAAFMENEGQHCERSDRVCPDAEPLNPAGRRQSSMPSTISSETRISDRGASTPTTRSVTSWVPSGSTIVDFRRFPRVASA